jgi:hypothetical protein
MIAKTNLLRVGRSRRCGRMRRLFLAVALALAVAAVTAGTSAASHQENGIGGPNDFAVGSFTTQFPDSPSGLSTQMFRFSAHSGPAGEDPKGYVVTSIPTVPGPPEDVPFGEVELKGHVTCLQVRRAFLQDENGQGLLGWAASIEAKLDEPIKNGTQVYTHVQIFAFDRGVQGNNAPTVSSSTQDPVYVEPVVAPARPPSCISGSTRRFIGEDHGNVTIHNAAP